MRGEKERITEERRGKESGGEGCDHSDCFDVNCL